MTLAFGPVPTPVILSDGPEYPVRRIFCVGRNYADHAREMGHEPDRAAPFYFTKSPMHLTTATNVPFPTETGNYHHEMELAVLLGAPAFRVSVDDAMDAVWGYACALDMTRRDLQALAKDKARPWDLGKDVEASAIFGTATRDFAPADQTIEMKLNGEVKQAARLTDLIHSIPEVIADLSRFYHLGAGDVILTGTPAGVGPVQPGDRIDGTVDGVPPLTVTFDPAE